MWVCLISGEPSRIQPYLSSGGHGGSGNLQEPTTSLSLLLDSGREKGKFFRFQVLCLGLEAVLQSVT